MAWNGDMTRSFYGGIPIVIYNTETVYIGDMARSFYGGIPIPLSPTFVGTTVESGDVPETVTLTDVIEGINATIITSTAETATITDAWDACALNDGITETATLTDVMAGTGFVDGEPETATLTDALGRQFEVERTFAETTTFSDLMEAFALVDGMAETITLDDREFGAPGNVIRRKQMLWDIQNKHIQIKFSHNQASKCSQAEDCSIRSGLIRRQDTTRLCHQGDHLALKFQNADVSETILLEMIALQVNRVSNLYSVQWHDAARLCHQGNHLQLKIQHNTVSEMVLVESMALLVNRIDNPTANWSR